MNLLSAAAYLLLSFLSLLFKQPRIPLFFESDWNILFVVS